MVPTMPCGCGDQQSLHSPYPTTPSSVATFTKSQGRQPASTTKVSTLVIFMDTPLYTQT